MKFSTRRRKAFTLGISKVGILGGIGVSEYCEICFAS